MRLRRRPQRAEPLLQRDQLGQRRGTRRMQRGDRPTKDLRGLLIVAVTHQLRQRTFTLRALQQNTVVVPRQHLRGAFPAPPAHQLAAEALFLFAGDLQHSRLAPVTHRHQQTAVGFEGFAVLFQLPALQVGSKSGFIVSCVLVADLRRTVTFA